MVQLYCQRKVDKKAIMKYCLPMLCNGFFLQGRRKGRREYQKGRSNCAPLPKCLVYRKMQHNLYCVASYIEKTQTYKQVAIAKFATTDSE